MVASNQIFLAMDAGSPVAAFTARHELNNLPEAPCQFAVSDAETATRQRTRSHTNRRPAFLPTKPEMGVATYRSLPSNSMWRT